VKDIVNAGSSSSPASTFVEVGIERLADLAEGGALGVGVDLGVGVERHRHVRMP
jgi:hypothetical protein